MRTEYDRMVHTDEWVLHAFTQPAVSDLYGIALLRRALPLSRPGLPIPHQTGHPTSSVMLMCRTFLVLTEHVHGRGVLQEMESVVTKARHFQFKPDGNVTFMMAQDAVGLPAPLMQVCPLSYSPMLALLCTTYVLQSQHQTTELPKLSPHLSL